MGQGAYADVFLVEHLSFGSRFAMKRVAKSLLKSAEDIHHVLNERKIMETANHPFIISLHYAFQSDKFLYYVIDFAEGGELFTTLRRRGTFSERIVQLYAAEIVLALSHLHSNNILYSDLKLENLLIDSDGHIKLTDFGLSQVNCNQYTIRGTREYLSPEALLKKSISTAVDWWALVGLLGYRSF